MLGNKTLELRPSSVDKSTVTKAILKDLNADDVDFVLCIGDGRTDEVIFSMLHDVEGAITCTVGKKQTEGMARRKLHATHSLVYLSYHSP